MLTDKDINRIIAVVATKQDVREVGQRIDKLEDIQKRILSALDRLATAIEKQNLEYAGISMQLSRHERWIQQIAKKAKVSLED